MAERSYGNPIGAVWEAFLDRRSEKGKVAQVSDDVRLDGRTCLVTGANSGLGKAAAILLARRGAHVIMACRSGIPEAGEDVKAASGSERVEMMRVDLSDFDSIRAFCDELRDRKVTIDVGIFNAGLMPAKPRQNKHGFDLMFAVNFLAKHVVLHRLLSDGVIPNSAFGGNSRRDDPPRIIFVSSETHRSSEPIDFSRFAEPFDYGVTDGVKYYGLSKLHLTTFARELSRRLNTDGEVDVCVHAMCPGGVNSNMAREAPNWLKPLLKPMMSLLFQTPEDAAAPLVYMACSRDMGSGTAKYMHLMRIKDPSDESMNAEKGAQLWQQTEELLREHGALT